MSISIIIPTLNEEQLIGPCLDRLLAQQGQQNNCSGTGNTAEIIVVDGGSTDQTIPEASGKKVSVISSEPGRGTQQHRGTEAAHGDILLFLHCDTELPETFPEDIYSALQEKGAAAGAFRLKIDGNRIGFRLIEAGIQLRTKFFSLPYGDQALFMRRETYFAAGGFPQQPIMEDVALVHRLKKLGSIAITQTHVTTSARRWQQHGLVKTTVVNQLMLLGRAIGIPSQQLARFYYAQRK